VSSSSTIRRDSRKDKKENPLKPLGRFVAGVAKVAGGTILGFTMLGSSIAAGGLVGLAISFRNLPDVRVLRNYVPSETSFVYDVNGKLLASLHGEENRKNITLDQVAPELKMAVLAIEDSHFFYHQGVNPYSVGRAVVVNYQSGAVVEGASTLTMQLVKNLFLSKEKSYNRKLTEAVLSVRVEQIFSKNEILEMYLNNIYWGHNNYGVQTAAETYFNKKASDLNLAESAVMAGLIQAPEDYSPFIDYTETKKRQKVVLDRMVTLGWITPEEGDKAFKEPLLVAKPTAWQTSELPVITEAVVEELKQRFGEDAVVRGGMQIQTTVDYNEQKYAEDFLRRSHQNIRARGFYPDQMAMAAVDPRTHFVKALVGSVDYDKSQFNRAAQARRQPGSSFKPFVYYTAFASGKYTPYSTIQDSPVSYRDGGAYYSPKNYGGSFSGTVSLRSALIQSLNIPAIKLGRNVGLDKVIAICRILGVKSPLQPVISLPLGPIGVTPLEMAGAYATFASNGWHSDPTVIVRVTDSEGNILLDNTAPPKLVLDPWATASLTAVLQGVISEGTAKNANIGRPAAGKTGTTDSEKDVWFVGYVPQLSVAVWIGNDNFNKRIGSGATGGGLAAPIWRNYMNHYLKNQEVQYFPAPSQFPRPKPQ
jgi:penicillin-binding protein 1A